MSGRILTTIGFFLILFDVSHAKEFTTLEERMTGKEFEQAGLGQLTQAQLAYLNEWLRTEGQAPVPAPATAASGQPAATSAVSEEQMGLRQRGKGDDRVVIESTIDGDFRGWEGRTRFKLANGQVWQQVGGGTYYAKRESPPVRIEPKALGSWKMYVDGIGRSVKVKRVK